MFLFTLMNYTQGRKEELWAREVNILGPTKNMQMLFFVQV